MKEEFVSYEQSKMLKALGFDWECERWYDPESTIKEYHGFLSRNHNVSPVALSAPTQALAAKWLRDVKGIDVLVFNCACGYGWEISKADPKSRGTTIAPFDDNGEDEASGMWLSYEKALSQGISQALTLLTEPHAD